MDVGRLFFRVIEAEDGCWACKHGRRVLDWHGDHDAALLHITQIADGHRPSQVFVHHLDGRVLSVAALD